MEWSRFLDLLAKNEYFRSGFFSALFFVAIGWAIWWVLHWGYVQWLRVRRFFEPTKMPGPVPAKTGPSPAASLLGCMGSALAVLLLVAVAIAGMMLVVRTSGG